MKNFFREMCFLKLSFRFLNCQQFVHFFYANETRPFLSGKRQFRVQRRAALKVYFLFAYMWIYLLQKFTSIVPCLSSYSVFVPASYLLLSPVRNNVHHGHTIISREETKNICGKGNRILNAWETRGVWQLQLYLMAFGRSSILGLY